MMGPMTAAIRLPTGAIRKAPLTRPSCRRVASQLPMMITAQHGQQAQRGQQAQSRQQIQRRQPARRVQPVARR